jgi:hypothetical protein
MGNGGSERRSAAMIPQPAATSAERKAQALLAGLIDVRARILAATASLPANSRGQIFLGSWSVRDLVAHLIGWDHTNLKAVDEVLRGRLPGFYRYADRDWRSYNATLVLRYGDPTFRRLTASARQSHRALLKRLKALPAKEMWEDRGIRFRGWKVTIGRLMEVERQDEEEHWRQIVEFARSLPH